MNNFPFKLRWHINFHWLHRLIFPLAFRTVFLFFANFEERVDKQSFIVLREYFPIKNRNWIGWKKNRAQCVNLQILTTANFVLKNRVIRWSIYVFFFCIPYDHCKLPRKVFLLGKSRTIKSIGPCPFVWWLYGKRASVYCT